MADTGLIHGILHFLLYGKGGTRHEDVSNGCVVTIPIYISDVSLKMPVLAFIGVATLITGAVVYEVVAMGLSLGSVAPYAAVCAALLSFFMTRSLARGMISYLKVGVDKVGVMEVLEMPEGFKSIAEVEHAIELPIFDVVERIVGEHHPHLLLITR